MTKITQESIRQLADKTQNNEKETRKPESKSVEVKARYIKISFQKLNLMAKVVRDCPLAEAERTLTFSKTKAGKITLQLLKSAKAAAVQKGLDLKKLYLTKLLTQQGPSLKRGQPVSRGSSHPIAKKSAHLILKLEELYGTKN